MTDKDDSFQERSWRVGRVEALLGQAADLLVLAGRESQRATEPIINPTDREGIGDMAIAIRTIVKRVAFAEVLDHHPLDTT